MGLDFRRSWRLAAMTLLALASPLARAHAQQGSITVRVVDKSNQRPVDQAQVFVVGTTIGGLTNAEGTFVLRGVPPGSHTVRVLRVGYGEAKQAVTVGAGETARVEIEVEPLAINLAPVVTTATGATRRVEIGNAVTALTVADKIAELPIKTLADVLVAKAPGVQILPSNMTGGGSRVRIRGTSSLSLSNDPIYVIDGIRMTSNRSDASIGVGGTSPSRVNDLSPDDIESVEIVKGPSAATLYGTDAANGVIVITTKKGRAGRAEWTVLGEQGLIKDRNEYPTQYAILGHTPANPTTPITCMLKDLALGTCIKDSTAALNIFKDPETTPIDEGFRQLLSLQLRGGTESVRYYTSGEVDNEVGVFKMPAFARRRLDSLNVSILPEWNRPNTQNKLSFRANLNATPNPTLDLAVQSSYIRLTQRLPQVDNNVNSFWYNGTMGPGWKGAGPGYTGRGSIGQELKGYAFATPAEIFQYQVSYDVQRFIGGSNADWRPFSWMNNHADVGVDLTSRIDKSLCRFQTCPDFGTQRLGFANDARATLRNITGNITSTSTWNARSWLSLKTSIGVQYVNYTDLRNTASGSQLPPGARVPGAATIQSASSSTTFTRTLGLFIEEAASLNDRLFLTAAVRSDQNSAFGSDFQRVYYPKGSVSWLISDEGFFPRLSWLNEFRLRGAIGASGVQPGPNDALTTFTTVQTNIGNVDVTGLRSAQLGNPKLKPERATEWEAGFEARLFGSRLTLDLTHYNKRSKDALINQILAPSSGASAGSILTNLGSVRNWGWEGQVNANLVDRPAFGWDITVSGSHNSNKLITLGNDPSGRPIPPIIGNTIRQIPGYPLNGYWQRPFTYQDANNDGIIVPSEVTVDTGFVFLGYSQPRLEVALTNSMDFLQRRLRLNVLVDHKSGYRLLNSEQQFLCQQRTNGCRGLTYEGASLWEQARAIAQRFSPVQSLAGYIEDPSFWRIREVSLSYTLPDRMAERLLRARGASISFAGRNLAVFTDWTGADPEQNYSQGDTQLTLLTAGPPTYYTLRVNIRY